ncbi:MAG: hypothetical protein U9O56_05540 [Campylobacterota bacterium]|nr:hypothetical protein [Campylobacterota bacterium]
MRHKIVLFLNNNFEPKNKIQSEWIVYILTIFFIAVISVGMLMYGTKDKYSDISDGFEEYRTKAQEKKGGGIFDINFDIFN